MIQVQGVPADISMPWRWTDAIGNYELVDKQKHRYKSAGVVVKIQQGKAERMLARYDAQKQAVPSIGKQEGKPVGIWLYFLVPSNAQIAQLEYKKELIRELDAN
jgi:hypothetical protein